MDIELYISVLKKHKNLMKENNLLLVKPFLLITPLGLSEIKFLYQALKHYGIEINSTIMLKNWNLLSSLMYVHRYDYERIKKAIIYEKYWSLYYPENNCQVVFLSVYDFYKVTKIKYQLRNELESKIFYEDFNIFLRAFHLPDLNQLENDFMSLSYIQNLTIEQILDEENLKPILKEEGR